MGTVTNHLWFLKLLIDSLGTAVNVKPARSVVKQHKKISLFCVKCVTKLYIFFVWSPSWHKFRKIIGIVKAVLSVKCVRRNYQLSYLSVKWMKLSGFNLIEFVKNVMKKWIQIKMKKRTFVSVVRKITKVSSWLVTSAKNGIALLAQGSQPNNYKI